MQRSITKRKKLALYATVSYSSISVNLSNHRAVVNGDGLQDYIWIGPAGKIEGFLNLGKGSNKWQSLGNIATINRQPDQLRTAVLTKSRRANYVVIDKTTGRAEWFENMGPTAKYSVNARGEFAVGMKSTIEGSWGWKFSGENVKFAE